MANQITQRLDTIRKSLTDKNIHAFIIPTTDAHLSEYPALHWASRVWISGFTGSAGTIVVTRNKAALWTDSRYFIQAEKQLKGTSILLQKEGLPQTPSIVEWLTQELKEGESVGIDASVYSAKEAFALDYNLELRKLKLVSKYDPFADVWQDRPIIPENSIFVLSEKHTGESASSKIERINHELEKHIAQSLVVASLDTIAWIFNIRGNDVKCNPVAVCFAYISKAETVLFINPKKLTKETSDYLKGQGVKLAEYDKIFDYLGKLDETVCLESGKVTLRLHNSIAKSCRIIDIASPADLMKSKKNKTELEGFRNAMTRDGVALVKFLIWLEKELPSGKLDEVDIAKKLTEFRSQQEYFVGESFDTIAGYMGNGAIVHYRAEKGTTSTVKPKGLLLLDSGAQYFDGTTDITRTLAVGELSQEMKEDYTLVLKGHINLSTAIYPEGTRGSQLDILARKALWNKGMNYLHGTGHGIGHFLNVHEGPQSIRMNENPTTLQIGMVTSNEPGIYKEGKHGVRIENLVVTQKEMATEFGEFYSFETLTACPIDTKPILKELLSQEEIDWLNNYHKFVYKKLSPFLDANERKWLKEKTDEI